MEKLYRITSLEGFMSIIVNKKERYVNPIDEWEDTYEGYFLRLLSDDDKLMEIIDRLYNVITKRAYKATCKNIAKLLSNRYDCYGLCWSILEDSDAMWRIYSNGNKAIQIVSSEQRIRDMLNKAGKVDKDIAIYKVKYDLVNDEDIIEKMLSPKSTVDAAYFHKREAFSHEKETRVIIHESKSYEEREEELIQLVKQHISMDGSTEITQTIREVINQQYIKKYYSDRKTEVSLNIYSLPEYIEGIRVHPMAKDWYVDLIKKICNEYKLPFLGRSDLYNKPLEKKIKRSRGGGSF